MSDATAASIESAHESLLIRVHSCPFVVSSLRGGFFQLFPEDIELVRVEIGQHLAINLNDRRKRLPAKFDHLLPRRPVAGYVQRLELNPTFFQPILRLVAPSTIRLYE